MLGRILTFTSLVCLWFALATATTWAAPGKPIPMTGGCDWHGVYYANGAIHTVHYPGHNDFYRCQVGSWVYIGSSDDKNGAQS